MKTPILLNHDHTKPIGFVEAIDKQLYFWFDSRVRITKDKVFEIFGNAGVQILEATEDGGEWVVHRGRLVEWSLSLQPAIDLKITNDVDPCPCCRKGAMCKTPMCGRLKLPPDHPLRNQP